MEEGVGAGVEPGHDGVGWMSNRAIDPGQKNAREFIPGM